MGKTWQGYHSPQDRHSGAEPAPAKAWGRNPGLRACFFATLFPHPHHMKTSTPQQVTMHRSSGQELVEYALILPILLALLLGIMELGLTVFNYNTMSNAAREAARAGIVTRDEPTIRSAGLKLTAATLLTTTNFTIKWLDKNNVTVSSAVAVKVRVTVARDYHLVTGPFLTLFGLRGTLPMTATATMLLE